MDQPKINSDERAFAFLRVNDRQSKPRDRGVTEIRGPYYTPMGKRYLEDVLETMSAYIDVLKGHPTGQTLRGCRCIYDYDRI